MARPKKQTTPEETTPAIPTTPAQPTKRTFGIKSKLAASKSFDMFAQPPAHEATRELLAKAKLAGGFKSAAETSRDYLPVPWLAFQYLIGRVGIPVNTICEFIGQENIGKSSLVMALVGNFIKHNIPCLYCNTEPKMLETDWIERLMSAASIEDARKISQYIEIKDMTLLSEMDDVIRNWLDIKRNKLGIAHDVPLVIVVDSISNLLNEEEAKIAMGAASDDDEPTTLANKKGKKKAAPRAGVKGLSELSKQPGITAKFMHEWTRSMKSVLERYNATILCVAGQTQSMSTGTSSFAADGGASLNKSRIGGTAMNMKTALQITVTRNGMWKNSANECIGEIVRARVVKNSYGPKYRDIIYNLQNTAFKDTDTTLDNVFDMDSTFCDILVANKILGLTCTRKLYTSEQLNLYNVSARVLYNHIVNDEDLTGRIGVMLKIKGYEAFNEES